MTRASRSHADPGFALAWLQSVLAPAETASGCTTLPSTVQVSWRVSLTGLDRPTVTVSGAPELEVQ